MLEGSGGWREALVVVVVVVVAVVNFEGVQIWHIKHFLHQSTYST